MSFFQSLVYFIISSATCSWYFGEHKEIGSRPVLRGLYWGLTFNFGSLALGSFFLPFFWVFRVIAQFLYCKANINEQDNQAARLVLRSLNMVVSFFELLVKHVNKHSYTEMALHSSPYFSSARKGFQVVQANLKKFGLVQDIGEMVFFMGQLIVSLGVTQVSLMVFRFFTGDSQRHSTSILTFGVTVFLGSWLAATVFCSLWDASSSTLLHCHYLDEEIHASDGQGVKFASDKLLFALRTGRTE